MDAISARARLLHLLPEVAQEYGARKELPENILKESADIIQAKFPYLALDEIREAYRQWSVGEFVIKGGEMYGGEFNVAQLAKVLSTYCENRKTVLAEYIRQRDNMIAEEKGRAGRLRKRQEFETTFPAMVAEKRLVITDWREVPEFWYEALFKRGLIAFEPGEAQRIFSDASDLVEIERRRLEDERRQLPTFQKLAFAIPEDDDHAKSIARKLTVFRKVVLSDWKP